MNFSDHMPLDPFEGDPNDPASFLDPDEPFEPLTDEEKLHVQEDLKRLRQFKEVLSPVGIQGICMQCEDCDELHYYDWHILIDRLVDLLNDEQPAMHEPSADPDPNKFAPWEYCVGYMDGLARHTFGDNYWGPANGL